MSLPRFHTAFDCWTVLSAILPAPLILRAHWYNTVSNMKDLRRTGAILAFVPSSLAVTLINPPPANAPANVATGNGQAVGAQVISGQAASGGQVINGQAASGGQVSNGQTATGGQVMGGQAAGGEPVRRQLANSPSANLLVSAPLVNYLATASGASLPTASAAVASSPPTSSAGNSQISFWDMAEAHTIQWTSTDSDPQTFNIQLVNPTKRPPYSKVIANGVAKSQNSYQLPAGASDGQIGQGFQINICSGGQGNSEQGASAQTDAAILAQSIPIEFTQRGLGGAPGNAGGSSNDQGAVSDGPGAEPNSTTSALNGSGNQSSSQVDHLGTSGEQSGASGEQSNNQAGQSSSEHGQSSDSSSSDLEPTATDTTSSGTASSSDCPSPGVTNCGKPDAFGFDSPPFPVPNNGTAAGPTGCAGSLPSLPSGAAILGSTPLPGPSGTACTSDSSGGADTGSEGDLSGGTGASENDTESSAEASSNNGNNSADSSVGGAGNNGTPGRSAPDSSPSFGNSGVSGSFGDTGIPGVAIPSGVAGASSGFVASTGLPTPSGTTGGGDVGNYNSTAANDVEIRVGLVAGVFVGLGILLL